MPCARHDAEALNGQAAELDPGERDRIARALREDLVGLGAIAERMLSDPQAQEWMVNAPTRVFRDTGERLERVPDLVFKDDRHLRAFLERLLEQIEGKRLDRITPRVEARLPDGSRLTAAIPPVSSNGHPICTIRRFRLRAGTLDELARLDFSASTAASFLAACVRAGKNIVVCGRVSSGKTTLLNALGRAIPAANGRSSANPRRSYSCRPARQLHRLRSAGRLSPDGLPAVTLEHLVSDALRMNPDRIIVGECRGPETMAMLWAFATGHAGMTSVHGESVRPRAPQPRPLRPHLRRPHRGRTGTRLVARDRRRRPLRPAPRPSTTANGVCCRGRSTRSSKSRASKETGSP